MAGAAGQLSRIVESTLECPVCLSLPRELPVPCCPSGHIVCRSCRNEVKKCPVCRQKMPANMTNSVVGSLIEKVEHKCQYSEQGCKVKKLIKDLRIHEQRCPERTVECPVRNCEETVQLKKFCRHAIDTHHSEKIPTNWKVFEIPCDDDDRELAKLKWGMGIVSAFGSSFYLNLRYYKPSKCFVFSVWLAKSKCRAEKHRAFIRIGDKTEGDNELSFYGVRVTSIENIPSFDRCMEKNGKHFLCIPRILIENICEYNEENNENELHVELVMSEI